MSFDPDKTKGGVYYALRHLPPKTTGEGEIVFCCSTVGRDMTMEILKERYPQYFETPGFYTLMKSTGETLTVEAPK